MVNKTPNQVVASQRQGGPEVNWFILENLTALTDKLVQQVKDVNSPLVNKYLYLGEHGAMSWKDVDQTYKLGRQGKRLIQDHFQDIDSIIRATIKEEKPGEPESGYDIISLGCGTGEDDETILIELNKRLAEYNSLPTFNIITVDLSLPLLVEGTVRISNVIRNNELVNYIDRIDAICCDLDSFFKSAEYIRFGGKKCHRKNNRALFHLLGLTLANNDEVQMLSAISSVMKEGDFLLLGLDFSVEDSEALKKTISSYENEGARNRIDEFLCGPLHFSTRFEWMDSSHNFQLITELASNDSILYPLEVIHEHKENNGFSLSKVPNAVNLKRSHRIKSRLTDSHIPPRMCDFSNKYSGADFEVFIKNIKKHYAILFEVVGKIDAFGISDRDKRKHEPLQQLVLLRYGNAAKNVDLRESEKRAVEATLVKVREFIKRIENFHKDKKLIPVEIYTKLEAAFEINEANISRIIKLNCNLSKFPEIELSPSEESEKQCKKYLEKAVYYADLEDLRDE